LLAQTQKQNRQNRGVFAHKGAQTSAVIKFLSVLTTHTGATCNQPVEPAKDWRSDFLAKRTLIGVELCGVLGKLQSNQGLAQSNNNAKLNYSAKHEQKLLETSSTTKERKGTNYGEGGSVVITIREGENGVRMCCPWKARDSGAIRANTAYARDSRWAPFSPWTFLFFLT
jgi:hypothetical protein